MANLVLTRPLSGGGGATLPGNIELTIINGQPTLTFLDTSRLVGSPMMGKRLSVAEHNLVFAENNLDNLDWVRIANASDGDSGFIADFDGTVVFTSMHCENTGANSKDIHLFINAVDQGSIGTLTGGANVTVVDTTLNIDFSQGDRIRLQAQNGSGGQIQDTIIKVTVKWRG